MAACHGILESRIEALAPPPLGSASCQAGVPRLLHPTPATQKAHLCPGSRRPRPFLLTFQEVQMQATLARTMLPTGWPRATRRVVNLSGDRRPAVWTVQTTEGRSAITVLLSGMAHVDYLFVFVSTMWQQEVHRRVRTKPRLSRDLTLAGLPEL